MTGRARTTLLVFGLLAIAGGLAWLQISSHPPMPTATFLPENLAAAPAEEAAPGGPAAPEPASEPAPLALPAPEQPLATAGQPPQKAAAAPDTSATFLGERVSHVPQQMLRSWIRTAQPGAPAVGGMTLVVDPNLSTGELDRLARDVHQRSLGAQIFHARIYDSEEAATYDKHSDGGAMAERHLVAVVTRNTPRGLDVIRVRGVKIELAEPSGNP